MPVLMLRRIIRLALLALAGLAFSGCSMVRLAYDQAPNLVYFWIDGYVDVNGAQTPPLRDAIERWFAWHRRTQLPDYADLLARVQGEVTEPTTPAAVCAWQAEGERRLDAALDEAAPAAAELILSLTPEQLLHIERRMAKAQVEMRAEFLQADPVERRAKSLERTTDRFETLYGRLDSGQRQRLAALLAASTFDAERWLGERRARQREMLQAMTLASDAARSGADRVEALQQAKVAAFLIVDRTGRSPRADYRVYQQRLTQDNCALIASMHNAMTPAQRQHARAKLKGWEDDLRTLIAAPAASDGNSVVSR
jgi:hypothetical protein